MARAAVISVVALVVISGLIWWGADTSPAWLRSGERGQPGTTSAALASAAVDPSYLADRTRPAEKTETGGLLVRDVADTTRALNTANSTVEQDLEILQSVIEFYRRSNDGKNPAGGLNEEIVKQLRGGNQKRVAVIPPDHPSINADGELLDRWGTPYYFHPVSSQILEIRSAGPDRELWTADDREIGTAPTVADEQ